MTLDRARHFLSIQVGFGSGYNANAAKLILCDMQREHDEGVVDQLIREFDLERVFGFVPGTRFEGGVALRTGDSA